MWTVCRCLPQERTLRERVTVALANLDNGQRNQPLSNRIETHEEQLLLFNWIICKESKSTDRK